MNDASYAGGPVPLAPGWHGGTRGRHVQLRVLGLQILQNLERAPSRMIEPGIDQQARDLRWCRVRVLMRCSRLIRQRRQSALVEPIDRFVSRLGAHPKHRT